MFDLNRLIENYESKKLKDIGWFLYYENALEEGLLPDKVEKLISMLLEIDNDLKKNIEDAYEEGYNEASETAYEKGYSDCEQDNNIK